MSCFYRRKDSDSQEAPGISEDSPLSAPSNAEDVAKICVFPGGSASEGKDAVSSASSAMTSKDSDPASHTQSHSGGVLVLLLHGLRGRDSDFDLLLSHMQKQTWRRRLVVIVPKVNSGRINFCAPTPTVEGIAVCARRAFKALQEARKENSDAQMCTEFSLVGYSLGGIIGRYMLKLMMEEGLIGNSPEAQMKPECFISIASPHLGITTETREKDSIVRTCSSIYECVAPIFAGDTGNELLVEDDDVILEQISDGKFLDALALFESRVCYGNVINDIAVDLPTSTLRLHNEYENAKLQRSNDFPSIVLVDECDHTTPTIECDGNLTRRKVVGMQERLWSLGWTRVDCAIEPSAHHQIIGVSMFPAAEDVLKHLSIVLCNGINAAMLAATASTLQGDVTRDESDQGEVVDV